MQQLDHENDVTLQEAPRSVISATWRPLVVDHDHQIQRDAYTICVLQELMRQLRQRDVYLTPSDQWHDPRQYLIDETRWKRIKPQICRLLDRYSDPEPELENLVRLLDDAYEQTNRTLRDDPNLRMEIIDGIPRPIVTPLDSNETTPEREILQNTLTKRLPAVDLPDLMLEVHQMTSFADAFTHVSERTARIDDLATSICAVLLAEGCNIGLEAVIDDNTSALSTQRLEWVQQNYIRPDTISEANRWLIQAQSQLQITQMWGGGDVASADGLRFAVPQRALHGGFNRKYLEPDGALPFSIS